MSSPTKPPPSGLRAWLWPFVFVVAIGVVFYISNRRDDAERSGTQPVRGAGDYQAVLLQATKLSEDRLIRFDKGEKLSSDDLSKLRDAAKLYEQLSGFAPTKMAPYFASGRIHLLLGEHQVAEDKFKRSIANSAHESNSANVRKVEQLTAEAQFFLAQCLLLDENWESAVATVNQALKARPNTPNYLYVRARARIQLRDLKGAEADLSAALRVEPGNPSCRGLLRFLQRARAMSSHGT
jgi:tetratricopeptide (TPR) repeat protein